MKYKLHEIALFLHGSPQQGTYLITIDPPIILDSENYEAPREFWRATEIFRSQIAESFSCFIDVRDAMLNLEAIKETEK
jgi:hypothetical protein